MNSAVVLTCPKCGAMLPQQARWMRPCSACGSNVHVDLFRAAFREAERGQAGETILDESESGCFYHPGKRAVVPCEVCGRFLCALCDLDVEGRHICSTCLSRERAEDNERRPKETRMLYDHMASDLAVIMVVPCFWYIVPLFAIPLLYICFRYWNAPKSVLSQGKWRMVLSAAVAVAAMIVWTIVIAMAVVGLP